MNESAKRELPSRSRRRRALWASAVVVLLIAVAFGVYWFRPIVETIQVEQIPTKVEERLKQVPFLAGMRRKPSDLWEPPGRHTEQRTYARPTLIERLRHGQTRVLNDKGQVIETQSWRCGEHLSSQVSYRDQQGRVIVTGKLIVADSNKDLAMELSRGRTEVMDTPLVPQGPQSPLNSYSGKLLADGEWQWWVANESNHSPRNCRIGDEIILGATLVRDDEGMALVFNGGRRAVTGEELSLPAEEIEEWLNLPPSDFSKPYRTFRFEDGWLTHVDGISTKNFFHDAVDHRDIFFRAERYWNYQFRADNHAGQLFKYRKAEDKLFEVIPIMLIDRISYTLTFQGSTAALPRIAIIHQVLATAGLVFDFQFGQLVVATDQQAADNDPTGVLAISSDSEVGRRLDEFGGVRFTTIEYPIPRFGRICKDLEKRLNRNVDDPPISIEFPRQLSDTYVRETTFGQYHPKTYRNLLGQLLQRADLTCTVEENVIKIHE